MRGAVCSSLFKKTGASSREEPLEEELEAGASDMVVVGCKMNCQAPLQKPQGNRAGTENKDQELWPERNHLAWDWSKIGDVGSSQEKDLSDQEDGHNAHHDAELCLSRQQVEEQHKHHAKKKKKEKKKQTTIKDDFCGLFCDWSGNLVKWKKSPEAGGSVSTFFPGALFFAVVFSLLVCGVVVCLRALFFKDVFRATFLHHFFPCPNTLHHTMHRLLRNPGSSRALATAVSRAVSRSAPAVV